MSTPSTIAKMILACLETAYVREVFLHAVSHVQNKANPDKPPHESAVSQIQQAKHLHEMFVKDLQIEHRLTLLAETAAQIVNGEPFQVPGQSTPTPPTPEHGQNQQPTESDLTLNQLTLTQSTKLRRQGLRESVHGGSLNSSNLGGFEKENRVQIVLDGLLKMNVIVIGTFAR